jgi:hypothetical protein
VIKGRAANSAPVSMCAYVAFLRAINLLSQVEPEHDPWYIGQNSLPALIGKGIAGKNKIPGSNAVRSVRNFQGRRDIQTLLDLP